MAIRKIEYKNKTSIQDDPDIAIENKATAEDFNEIKEVVNNNADEISKNAENIKTLEEANDKTNEAIGKLHNYDDTEIKKDIEDLKNNKVDKEDGKTLTDNNFSDEYKNKLDSLKNYDDTEIKNDITKIKDKNTEQDTEIQKLKDENTELNKVIKDTLINAETEGKRIHIEDASNLSATLEVLGNVEQETRQGYNIFDYLKAITLNSLGGLTVEKDYENGYITINGTPRNNYVNLFNTIDITDILEDGETYTIWQEKHAEKELDGVYMQVSVGEERYYSSKENTTFNVDKSLGRYIIGIQTGTINNIGTFSNYKNRYMLYKGTDAKDYELPGSSPSIDYPSNIKCLGSNKNLFDKDNANILNLYLNSNYIEAREGYDSIYISVKSNTNYVISIKANVTDYFRASTSIELPAAGTDTSERIINDGGDRINIKTREDDRYLIVMFFREREGIDNETLIKEALDSLKIIESDTEIKHYNKNLAKIDLVNKEFTKNGITITVDENGEVTLNGTATANFYINMIDITSSTANSGYSLPLGKYKAFFELLAKNNSEVTKAGGDIHFYFRNRATPTEENPSISYADFIRIIQGDVGATVKSMEITQDTIVSYIYVTNGVVLDNLKFRFAIYDENEKDTTYVKHEEENLVLDIQKPMLEGDYFVKEADGWKELHNWNKLTFTGNESWNKSGSTTEEIFVATLDISNGVDGQGYSNYFKYYGNIQVGVFSVYNNGANIRFCIDRTEITTIEEFKAWLQQKNTEGNPVVAYYKLTEPEKLACTDEQTEVLEQLSNLKLYKYTNNIFTAEDIAKLKLNYVVDTKKYIDNIIANTNKAIVERS